MILIVEIYIILLFIEFLNISGWEIDIIDNSLLLYSIELDVDDASRIAIILQAISIDAVDQLMPMVHLLL